MTVLVVGSVALDSVETPFGKADDVIGGSADTFSPRRASHLTPVQLVGIIGDDFPVEKLERAARARRRSRGTRAREGRVVPLARPLPPRPQLRGNARDAARRLLALSARRFPEQFRDTPYVFLGNIDPRLQLDVLRQVRKPKLVACDTMNFWIESRRNDLLALLEQVDLVTLNDGEARQLTEETNLVKAAKWIMAHGPRHVIIKKGEHGAFMFSERNVFFSPAYPLENRCSIPPARAIPSPAASSATWRRTAI